MAPSRMRITSRYSTQSIHSLNDLNASPEHSHSMYYCNLKSESIFGVCWVVRLVLLRIFIFIIIHSPFSRSTAIMQSAFSSSTITSFSHLFIHLLITHLPHPTDTFIYSHEHTLLISYCSSQEFVYVLFTCKMLT